MEPPSSLLLALPDTLLREVVSWSPDSATAHALLSTCSTPHQLRHDPAAAALLLLRCPCQDYHTALTSVGASCRAGVQAVVRQVLQLLNASPDSGGPTPAPQQLLQVMLAESSAAGDEHAIRALLALPQPPDVDAHHGWALESALVQGPHLVALRALLVGGADPCVDNFGDIMWAAGAPDRLPALLLLLQHCPLGDCYDTAIAVAVKGSVLYKNAATLEHLLPRAQSDALRIHVPMAAAIGDAAVLRLLLDRCSPSMEAFFLGLTLAVGGGHAACVAALLDAGAPQHNGLLRHTFRDPRSLQPHVRRGRRGLEIVFPGGADSHPAMDTSAAVAPAAMYSTVELLLERGMLVAQDDIQAVASQGLPDVVALLTHHQAAAAAAALADGADENLI